MRRRAPHVARTAAGHVSGRHRLDEGGIALRRVHRRHRGRQVRPPYPVPVRAPIAAAMLSRAASIARPDGTSAGTSSTWITYTASDTRPHRASGCVRLSRPAGPTFNATVRALTVPPPAPGPRSRTACQRTSSRTRPAHSTPRAGSPRPQPRACQAPSCPRTGAIRTPGPPPPHAIRPPQSGQRGYSGRKRTPPSSSTMGKATSHNRPPFIGLAR